MNLCTIIDIAERVRYEKQLELAKQAAETANRAKSDFLARMSHEIRTPMNLIMGMNALLLNSVLNDKQRQYVEISYRNVRRLLRLINGILDLSKVEAGKLTLDNAPFDLEVVLQECAATMSSALEQKGLLFETSIEPGTWRYWVGDSERLQQVLLNLIGNAIKFTARGSIKVAVSTQCGVEGARGLRFEVTDTGCGVAPDKAHLIFEDFQQADVAMNRSYEGTGLGLSIAKTLVEMMSGTIWLEQPPHPGARLVFSVFFPKTTQNAVSESVEAVGLAKISSHVEPGTRLLVAEDNPENVILLRAYLENVPLALHFACNGEQALEKRRHSNYDLILMDIQMPVMDGHTAIREIRKWEAATKACRVPILALTAHALNSAHSESLEAGADGHLTKPVERNELVAAIAKWARRPAGIRGETIPPPIAALRHAFLSNRWQDLERLKAALTARDFVTIRTIGHNCKGTGNGYGFPEISRLGGAIEQAAQTADIEAAQEGICEFEYSLVEARNEQSSF